MQEQYDKVREEMHQKRITGSAGNGLVTLVLDGGHKMHSITIKPECTSDLEGLQDLIISAYQDAHAQIDAQNNEMNSMFS